MIFPELGRILIQESPCICQSRAADGGGEPSRSALRSGGALRSSSTRFASTRNFHLRIGTTLPVDRMSQRAFLPGRSGNTSHPESIRRSSCRKSKWSCRQSTRYLRLVRPQDNRNSAIFRTGSGMYVPGRCRWPNWRLGHHRTRCPPWARPRGSFRDCRWEGSSRRPRRRHPLLWWLRRSVRRLCRWLQLEG